MTKFHNLEYLEYLELGQFRNFCDVLLVALVHKIKATRYVKVQGVESKILMWLSSIRARVCLWKHRTFRLKCVSQLQ